MVSDHLSDYLAQWHDVKELVRVAVEVSPVGEIAAITDRVCRTSENSPALLFGNVRGYSMPVVTNLLGGPRRISSAFGVPALEDISRRIDDWLSVALPRGIVGTWSLLPRLAELAQWPPTLVKNGPCQQVVRLGRDVNLAELPALTVWPSDVGPSIAGGQIHTRSPMSEMPQTGEAVTSYRHVCVAPLQVVGRDGLLVHADEQSEFRALLAQFQTRAQQMPVAIALGGDPLTCIAANAPLPARTDALVLAGFLRNKPVELVAARSVPLEVPANAEIVIEGFIDPQSAWEPAGSLGRETGFESLQESLPLVRVTAITHRSNAVFPAIVPAAAPAENHWLNRASERLMLPIAKLWIPELVDWRLPFAGATRHVVFVSIRKTFAQQARKVMHALWSLPRIATAKLLLLVDADVDLRDENAVWSQVAAHMDPAQDLVLWDGPADWLDHATTVRGVGRKLGIDATHKTSREAGLERPRPLSWTPDIEDLLRSRWAEYGIDVWLGGRR